MAGEYLAEHNPQARLTVFGQELNPESYAICKADMLIKGQDVANIAFGNTLSDDGHAHKKFDYMLSNPPFGVEWKKVEKEVRRSTAARGYNGRFGPGLPRVSGRLDAVPAAPDRQDAPGCGRRQPLRHRAQRLPLFTGGAGQRRERDPPLRAGERPGRAMVGLPTDMFYNNTGIGTYVWIISNRKARGAQRPGAADRRQRDVAEDAQEPRLKRKELSDAHRPTSPSCFEVGSWVEADAQGRQTW